ncbi:hypothetical protein ACFVT5_14325 [Streptomyces sp. NPDC058001]|uniref:hypothetical protein n=1 Tax=Streptomyces sp. NPDC058001 TaxID=3346300 RepID=UPI0036E43FC2
MYRLRRPAAALAVLLGAGALLAPAGSAQAVGPAVELNVPETAYLPQRETSPTGGVRLWLAPQPGAGRTAQSGVTLKVDASDLDGVARIRTRRACGDHAMGATDLADCALGTLTRGKDNYLDAVYIEAVPGARLGSHGTIRYTFSAPGAEDVVFETDVQIEGPDLRPRKEKPREGDAPGASFGFRPQIRNAGTFPAEGFGLSFSTSRVTFPTRYSNCRYGPEGSASIADCWFDQRIEPGQAYEVTEPISVGVPDTMVNGSFTYRPYLQGMTGNAEEDPGATGTDPAMRPGAGPELKVRPVDTPASAFADKFALGEVRLHTSQTSDLQVRADAIEGTTGSTAEATFHLRNAGPGRISGTSLRITVPEGLSVVAPTPPPDPDNELEWQWECSPIDEHVYTCGPDNSLEPGDTWETTLKFRIDRNIRGARGLLEAVHDPERPANDPKKSNNSAPIEVRASGSPLTEPTEPDPKPASATGERGGSDDSLPWVMAGVLGTTVLGGGALAYARRTRAARRKALPQPTGPTGHGQTSDPNDS